MVIGKIVDFSDRYLCLRHCVDYSFLFSLEVVGYNPAAASP